MKKRGFVYKVHDASAEVTLQRNGACGQKCDDCKGCESRPVSITLTNTIGARIGDYVEIETNDNRMLLFSTIMYLLPLVLFLFGFSISYLILGKFNITNELLSVCFGVVFMLFYKVLGKNIDASQEKIQSSAKISKIL